jgi:hypothetical protein
MWLCLSLLSLVFNMLGLARLLCDTGAPALETCQYLQTSHAEKMFIYYSIIAVGSDAVARQSVYLVYISFHYLFAKWPC